MISTINYSQHEIIKNIITLHLGGQDIECDPTYSKGNFYKGINKPIYRYDLYPKGQDVIESCSTSLPLSKASLNSLIFDPPFLATTGPSLKIKNNSNCINKRFSVFDNESLLHEYYSESIKEFFKSFKKGWDIDI